mgnify:CR=1 FL=1
MMTMTEMSGGGEGEGEGEESHVWYGAVTAVQKMFMYYRCRFGLLVLRIIDFQFNMTRLSQFAAAWCIIRQRSADSLVLEQQSSSIFYVATSTIESGNSLLLTKAQVLQSFHTFRREWMLRRRQLRGCTHPIRSDRHLLL